jgi:hypothetical protein
MSQLQIDNLTADISKEGKITITIDASKAAIKAAPLAKSEKNKLVASTGGFVVLGDGLKLSLNLIAPK